jgi:putative Mg2+ transporter-C (MgtC) family protein
MRERAGVKGLTTAASLWVVAAVGLAVGCGFYSAAIFSTLLTLVVLMVLRTVEGAILDREAKKTKTKDR